MKKLILAIGILALSGAGCAGQTPSANGPSINQPSANAPAETDFDGEPSVAPADLNLEPLPAIDQTRADIDDSSWTKFVTKSGVTFTYPAKGLYAPTWEYQILKSDDPHLRGNCYVTADAKYKRTDIEGFADACQTTTGIGIGPGTRTDYFVYKTGDRINLFVITKKYSDMFDMDSYSAVVDHIVRIIK
jgi:hypothetical protein